MAGEGFRQPGILLVFNGQHPGLAGQGRQAINLFYASLPAQRLRSAPQSTPRVSGVSEELLTVRIPVQAKDIAAAQASFACHSTQYTTGEMRAINRTLIHVWNGVNYLRPWNGPSISRRKPFSGAGV